MGDRFILGIAGKARSGKDTIADFLVREYSFTRFAFADPIKTHVNNMFGWDARHSDGDLKEKADHEWGFSPRQAYQKFGTEFGRSLHANLWLKMANRNLGPGLWVCPDVRFDNEATFCRLKGALIHVERPGVEAVNAHCSEAGVPIYKMDYQIDNSNSIECLHMMVDRCLNMILTKEGVNI